MNYDRTMKQITSRCQAVGKLTNSSPTQNRDYAICLMKAPKANTARNPISYYAHRFDT